ncbi:MAG: sigma-54-dependent Fis family transcriptional regulator [Candidatus Wallbacteria bacterium]|nr:sigma-54-dependent Fis family transcriptional regulator [Candidatus Wallbacteria bacterium]
MTPVKAERIEILIVDDEKSARLGMRRALESAGYDVAEAGDGAEAVKRIREGGVDLVFMDISMPGMDGLTALEVIRGLEGAPPVVMVTAHGSAKVAVGAIKAGAWDYVAKPYDVEEVRTLAKNASEKLLLERENRRLKRELEHVGVYGEILGKSKHVQDLLRVIDKVGPLDVTVLITGESGTGKELVARRVHALSQRAQGPFVSMNCAALPEDLIETELFGHEKGAFTGAAAARRGNFELADGGTLFLDEVGDMGLPMQSKLLRAIQEKTFHRVGGETTIGVDVRLVAATNRDLTSLIAKSQFREDLYYRLKVVEMKLPPLRERREDIPVLAEHFVAELSGKHGKQIRGITHEAMELLMREDWVGNIRQLRNAVESGVALAEGQTLGPQDFPGIGVASGRDGLTLPRGLPFQEAKKRVIREFEMKFIAEQLRENSHNISRTAEALGMHRQSLQQKMKELGLRDKDEAE